MCIICMFCAGAEGDTTSYELEALGMTIDFPNTMSVKTQDLAEGIHLEATTQDSQLTISVTMEITPKSEEIYSFTQLTEEDLQDYREKMLTEEEYIEGNITRRGEGKDTIPYLDFYCKSTTQMNVTVYRRQSVTLINGMLITIESQSFGDDINSDELLLIENALQSIHFSNIRSTAPKKTNIGLIITLIVVGLLLLAIAFVTLSYFMGKSSVKRKHEASRERRHKAHKNHYDVLRNADETNRRLDKIGGYKSSKDYFDSTFGADEADNTSASSAPAERRPRSTSSGSKSSSTSTAFTHMGYFFKNVKKEVAKNKKKSKKSAHRYANNTKGRRQSRDYDVFRDR